MQIVVYEVKIAGYDKGMLCRDLGTAITEVRKLVTARPPYVVTIKRTKRDRLSFDRLSDFDGYDNEE